MIKTPDKEEIQKLREKYTPGTQVQLISMADKYGPTPGTKGIVDIVDDFGQIHVRWDNGSSLALIPEIDEFRIVPN